MAKLAALHAFCQELKARLPKCTDKPSIEALSSVLGEQIRRATVIAGALFHKSVDFNQDTCADLDRVATDAWNLATKLRRDTSASILNRSFLLLQTRVFCFFLIDISRRACYATNSNIPVKDLLHLLELSLKAGKTSLDEQELDLALICLQRSADVLQQLHDLKPSSNYRPEFGRLEAEYFVLRTFLSWKQDHVDVAEHMFNKSSGLLKDLDRRSAESLAEILFEIGREFSQKGDFKSATKWLQRAYGILDSQDLENLSRHGVDLRLSILQSTTNALLKTNEPGDVQKAMEMISFMESEMGDRAVVLMLRVQLLESVPPEEFDVEAYTTILQRVTACFNFTDTHFKWMMHHIKKLHERDQRLACNVLDEFLVSKILAADNVDWLERTIVLRVWMTTQQESSKDFSKVDNLFSTIHQTIDSPLQPVASVAAQSLLWKRVDSCYREAEFKLADAWCRLAGHGLLKSAGPQNQARIQRKRILCAISQNDYENAKEIFHEMDQPSQAEGMTRYLMFKVALRCGDEELASDSLATMAASDDNEQFLYACILAAQDAGDRKLGAEAMKVLVQKHDFNSNHVHYPALLRSTIRMICAGIPQNDSVQEGNPQDDVSLEEDICQIFESAVEAIKLKNKTDDGKLIFNTWELDWFSKNAYNLGLTKCQTWQTRNTLRLFDSCLTIMTYYPHDMPLDTLQDLSLKIMCSNFIAGAGRVSLARRHDSIEERLQCYLKLRTHVAAFDKELTGWLELLGEDKDDRIQDDLLLKFATLLVFDFEAAVALKKWEDLAEVVGKASVCRDTTAYKAMADILFRAEEVPPQVLFSTQRAIISDIWKMDGMEVIKVAKYIRCLFQAVLPLKQDMAHVLLQEALHFIKQAIGTQMPYPDDEIEWLATMAWNHALDLFLVGKDDDEPKKWAIRAIELAHYGSDGVLEAQLQEKYQGLKWGSM